MSAQRVCKYAETGRIILDDDGSVVDDPTRSQDTDLGQPFLAYVNALSVENGCSWSRALEFAKATKRGRRLLCEYVKRSWPATDRPDRSHSASDDRPDVEIDRKARAILKAKTGSNYGAAVKTVLSDNPGLARRYNDLCASRR